MQKENNINLPNITRDNPPSSPAPYVPGDFTEHHHRPDSYDDLAKNRYKKPENHLIGKGYPRYREDFSRVSPRPEKNLSEQVSETLAKHKEMQNTTYAPRQINDNDGTPVRDAISNFQLAKELHRQNLDHIPLPDKITHDQYQKFQMMRDKEPGLALDEGNYATDIGWKGYQGYGPTRCTKLKVFRPKSSLLQPRRPGEKANSWANFEQKWRFIKHSKVTPIDLALCWDLSPENPKDEPKPPLHIDGSNGCLAPAVFSLVHTPKENVGARDSTREKCDGIHGCGPLFYSTNKLADERNYFFERRSARDFSEQLEHKLDESKRANSAYELREISKMLESTQHNENQNKNKDDNNNNNSKPKNNTQTRQINSVKCNENHPCCEKQRKKLLPTLKPKHSAFCMTCKMNNISIQEPKHREDQKSNFKAAFKAGMPQKRVSRNHLKDRCLFRAPKQKEPYALKNYRIDSLAPPFSLQKERRQDYPEHWRLATVYQHSYKPMNTRKGTLLSTVFK
ncbi:hypothetical protein HHI36_012135 [Cryptolaemus montrouzieri]|uniref:DUF4812 domain-containing protein n=1 Tax=Cryptolaemus montrouzieri TaxID=559131 RepID=A0ABD2NDC9_9CUCU